MIRELKYFNLKMDWKECFNKKLIKNISEDRDLVISLRKNSDNKSFSASKLNLSEITASSVIILHYDSLRELLEALALSKGYKIYGHECFSAFLSEIIKEEDLAERFDKVRKLRNSINYYGKSLSINDANDIIQELKYLKKEIKALFNN